METVIAERIEIVEKSLMDLTVDKQYEIKLFVWENRNLTSIRKLSRYVKKKFGVSVAFTTIYRWIKDRPNPPSRLLTLRKPIGVKAESSELLAIIDSFKKEMDDRLKDLDTTADKLLSIAESNILRKEQISMLIDEIVLERMARIAAGESVNGRELLALAKLADTYSLKPSEVLKIASLVDSNYQDKRESQMLLFDDKGELIN